MAGQYGSGRRVHASSQTVEGLEPRRLLAATPVPVGDIDQTGDVLAPQGQAVQSGKYAYFAGHSDGMSGTQLFRTDGTKSGTVLVKVINPTGSANPTNFTDVNGTVFFAASDGVHGTELWKSNGTAAGTVMVEDINPGAASSSPTDLVAVRQGIYLRATDNVSTGLFHDIDGGINNVGRVYASTGETSAGQSIVNPTDIVNADGQVFFIAQPTRTSTTPTLYVENNGQAYAVGGAPTGVADLAAVGRTLVYDAATLGTNGYGYALYRSTGNFDNTLIKSFASSGTSVYLSNFTVSGNYVYFQNETETTTTGATTHTLWRTDGTAAGTVSLGTVQPYLSALTPFGTHGLLFTNRTDAAGVESWVSDGTAAGTKLLKDLAAGTASGAQLFGGVTTLANGRLLFTAGPSIGTPTSVYTTDGTAAGTKLVTTIKDVSYATAVAGRLNGVALLYGYGSGSQGDLYRSDGTASGTYRVGANIAANGSGLRQAGGGRYGPQFVVIGSTVYFVATDGKSGYELYKTVNGATPTRVADLNPGGDALPYNLTAAADGSLYFQATTDGTNFGIYRIAPGGTTPKLVVAPGAASGSKIFINFAVVGNVLYFTGYPPAPASGGLQLWRYDPAANKTSLVFSDSAYLTFTNFVQAGSNYYFGVFREDINQSAGTVTDAERLYRLSSPTATPQLVKEITPPEYDGDYDFGLLGASGSTVYFYASSTAGGEGAKLWASDGTAAGTRQVADVSPNSSTALGTRPTYAAGGYFYFTASDATSNHLYRTDGTTAGTVVVGGSETSGHDFVTAGGNVYFVGSAVTYSNYGPAAIYRLDGTTATALTTPPPAVSTTAAFNPTGLFAAGNSVYAVATENGATELWQADSAFKNFGKVATLTPGGGLGALASFNQPDYLLAATASDLYFPMYTAAKGVEPYRLPLSSAPVTNTAGLSGYAFDDANGDGKLDGSDQYTAGKTIFLDANNNGVLDAGEISVKTDASGKFAFNGLAAGTYHVRRVFVSGYTYSTAKIDLVLTTGQEKTGLLIGTKKA